MQTDSGDSKSQSLGVSGWHYVTQVTRFEGEDDKSIALSQTTYSHRTCFISNFRHSLKTILFKRMTREVPWRLVNHNGLVYFYILKSCSPLLWCINSQKQLVTWLRILLRNTWLVEYYYQPWSYVVKTGAFTLSATIPVLLFISRSFNFSKLLRSLIRVAVMSCNAEWYWSGRCRMPTSPSPTAVLNVTYLSRGHQGLHLFTNNGHQGLSFHDQVGRDSDDSTGRASVQMESGWVVQHSLMSGRKQVSDTAAGRRLFQMEKR